MHAAVDTWEDELVFCGIDWSERHHDVAIVDRDGQVVAKQRVSDDWASLGLAQEA